MMETALAMIPIWFFYWWVLSHMNGSGKDGQRRS